MWGGGLLKVYGQTEIYWETLLQKPEIGKKKGRKKLYIMILKLFNKKHSREDYG